MIFHNQVKMLNLIVDLLIRKATNLFEQSKRYYRFPDVELGRGPVNYHIYTCLLKIHKTNI